MKTHPHHTKIFFFFICLLLVKSAWGQGRVVINEYMPWTLNGCGATSEFVELMNFGPGPVNIGCYILTDGDFAVTIPPNTILQPGEFYVIAGQDLINFPCANIDSTIHADLNWNTCGCASGPIPTTGDGFFTDGGSANEQIVLLDPSLNVVDAVVRDFPVEPSSLITTNTACGVQSFDLDLMNVRYETLGMSTGRGNSFARKLDGDCGWVKDPQQSGHATNNTPGELSSVNYTLSIVQSMDCGNGGSIDIYVDVSGYTGTVFPMNYTIALDADNNGIFNFSDTYTYGVDSTPPSIFIGGLPLGRYKITVASVNGCFLKTFDVTILECQPPLPVQLVYFRLLKETASTQSFEWLVGDAALVGSIHLEKSMDGRSFITAASLEQLNFQGSRLFTQHIPKDNRFRFFRLRLTDKNGRTSYSMVIKSAAEGVVVLKPGPNPVSGELAMQLSAARDQNLPFTIVDFKGAELMIGQISLRAGVNDVSVALSHLPAGVYLFRTPGDQGLSMRFVKH